MGARASVPVVKTLDMQPCLNLQIDKPSLTQHELWRCPNLWGPFTILHEGTKRVEAVAKPGFLGLHLTCAHGRSVPFAIDVVLGPYYHLQRALCRFGVQRRRLSSSSACQVQDRRRDPRAVCHTALVGCWLSSGSPTLLASRIGNAFENCLLWSSPNGQLTSNREGPYYYKLQGDWLWTFSTGATASN